MSPLHQAVTMLAPFPCSSPAPRVHLGQVPPRAVCRHGTKCNWQLLSHAARNPYAYTTQTKHQLDMLVLAASCHSKFPGFSELGEVWVNVVVPGSNLSLDNPHKKHPTVLNNPKPQSGVKHLFIKHCAWWLLHACITCAKAHAAGVQVQCALQGVGWYASAHDHQQHAQRYTHTKLGSAAHSHSQPMAHTHPS